MIALLVFQYVSSPLVCSTFVIVYDTKDSKKNIIMWQIAALLLIEFLIAYTASKFHFPFLERHSLTRQNE